MNIVIIDHRYNPQPDAPSRTADLMESLHPHTVSAFQHVWGAAGANPAVVRPNWPEELVTLVRTPIQTADLVLLHVGTDQPGAENALRYAYQDHYVVCFTGAPLPTWCRNDCNQRADRHAFLKGGIAASDSWPPWSKDLIRQALDRMDASHWAEAKKLLEGFDKELEDSLAALYAALARGESAEKLLELRDAWMPS